MKKFFFLLLAMFSVPGMAFMELKTRVTTHMSNPASIAYSAEENCYYISNINGNPEAKSNNGFITRLSIDEHGSALTEVVLKGGEGDTILNAPKGIVYHRGLIYVTDIDTLRVFAVNNSGVWKPVHYIPVPSSRFLNAIALDRKGNLWMADSAGHCLFELRPPYDKKIRRRFFYHQFMEPMGLALDQSSDQLWVSSLNGDAIYKADLKSREISEHYHLRINGLAGICTYEQGKVAVADFNSKAYVVSIDGNKIVREAINKNPLKKPSGIIYEPVSGLLLVAELKDNAVSIFMMPQSEELGLSKQPDSK